MKKTTQKFDVMINRREQVMALVIRDGSKLIEVPCSRSEVRTLIRKLERSLGWTEN